MLETDIIDQLIYGQRDTVFTANMLHKLAVQDYRTDKGEQIGPAQAVVVDGIGVGGGVVDNLSAMCADRYDVIEVGSGEAARDPERYVNKRAEMWDTVARMFCEGEVELHHEDQELRGQLCVPTYQFKTKNRLLVEPKSEIKKRLGRSPDRADCYVMGLATLEDISVPDLEVRRRTVVDAYRPKQEISSMAM
jgi:hypothetical protein